MSVAKKAVEERYGNKYIIYSAKKHSDYWVAQAMGIDVKYVWVKAKSGNVACINSNPNKLDGSD